MGVLYSSSLSPVTSLRTSEHSSVDKAASRGWVASGSLAVHC